MHGEALWTNGKLDVVKVKQALSEEGVRARYGMQALA